MEKRNIFKPAKTVLYTRISTEDQSLDSQIAALQKYCVYEDIEICDEFNDTITGASSTDDRIGFDKMNTYLLMNEDVKNVICYEYSRLGRSFIDSFNKIEEYKKRDINIYFFKEKLNTLHTDGTEKLQLQVLASIAEYERDTIKVRTIRGRKFKVEEQQGVQSGSIVQYGYKKENNKHVIDPDEAQIIETIFRMYLNNNSTIDIATFLNAENIKPRLTKLVEKGKIKLKGKKTTNYKNQWTKQAVRNLLRKRILIGFRTYQQKELPYNENYQIIDNETFQAVQTKLDNSRNADPNRKIFENVLRKKIACDCGYNYMMQKNKSGTAHQYKCASDKKCGAPQIDIDLLNNTVYFFLQNAARDDDAVKEKINAIETKINSYRLNNTSIKQALEEVKKKIILAFNTYSNGNLDEESFNTISTDNNKTVEEYNQLIIKNTNTINTLLNEIKLLNENDNLKYSNPETFKKFVKNIINKITIHKLDKNDKIKSLFPKVNNSNVLYITIDAGHYGFYKAIVNYNHTYFYNVLGNIFDTNFIVDEGNDHRAFEGGEFIGGSKNIELIKNDDTGLIEEVETITPMITKIDLPTKISIEIE